MWLSQPARRQLNHVQHPDAATRSCGNFLHNYSGCIGGAVVDRDDLKLAVILRGQRAQAAFDPVLLIEGRHNNTYALCCRTVPFSEGEIGQLWQAKEGIEEKTKQN